MIKSVLSEIDIFSEVKNEFTTKDVNSLLVKENNKNVEESVNNLIDNNNYIIFEGIGDTVDDVTTKIFSTVYQLLAKGLGAIGYTIKPELRNWFDRLVRKVFKLFKNTKLGQSIEELPPDVKKDVILKFQAIIGIIITVILIWIIISIIKSGTSVKANSNKNFNEFDKKSAGNDDFYKVDGQNVSGNVSMMELAKNNPKAYQAYKDYINGRVSAIKSADSTLDVDELADIRRQAELEFKNALLKGKILSIKDNKIIESNAGSLSNAAVNTTNNIANSSGAVGGAGSTKFYKLPGGGELKNVKISYAAEPSEIYDMRQQYITERLNAIKEANPKLSSTTLNAARSKLGMEYDYAYKNGQVLTIQDNKIVPLDGKSFTNALNDPKELLQQTGALDGTVANLDELPGLSSKFSVEQLIKSGIDKLNFTEYGVPVKIDLSNISEEDYGLNPSQLAEKYIKKVANLAADAKATEEELGI